MDFRSVAFLSLLLLSDIGCCAGQKRALKPGNLYSFVGQNVSFITNIDPVAQQLVAITWIFNSGSRPVPIITDLPRGVDVSDAYKDRIVFNRTTGLLVLKAVTTSDSGDYSVSLVQDDGVEIPGEVKLTVLGPEDRIVYTTPIEDPIVCTTPTEDAIVPSTPTDSPENREQEEDPFVYTTPPEDPIVLTTAPEDLIVHTTPTDLPENREQEAAFEDTKICYILDGILSLYGIIVTVLLFRMKRRPGSNLGHSKKKPEEGIYTGLTPHAQDTYETIRAQKKGMV